ncbi:AMP-binding protein [Gordonia sp. HY002]|uniref:AMP-binding protein n=1 Tax=Gordonia zhenghanii TaxID=2911516 RepID=UPI001EF0E6B6|nr:AMP-binding protein [Gordonia zhenghanii]MCF8569985.1 AMP-binding protein [Gordonia zhenghanii]MCF8604330.1 AMP-binding protein [Gordonia zhenghanii]
MTTSSVTDAVTLGQLLAPLADVDDRGIWFDGEFTSWRDHLADARRYAASASSLLDEERPAHVGVLLGNGVEFSRLFAAAALGGFVLVGLNSTRRGDALAADAALADCQLILVSPETAPLLPEVPGARTVDVSSTEWTSTVEAFTPGDFVPVESDPQDLTMLIFTSGTTGDPKAVRCSQRKFAAPGAMLADRFGMGPDDVAYLSMPMFHSNALIAGWSVAAAGGSSIAIAPRFSAHGFGDDVRRYGVTYANYVGKPLNYILKTAPRPDDAETGLRIMYGNEASAADRAEFTRRFGARVVDGFGSTESGVSISRTPQTPDDALGPLVAPVAVVDPDTLDAVDPGVVGEIVNMSGPGLFDGYYGDEAATAERMRGDVYRTGDLAWVDADGYVHFAGRIGDWLRVDGENLGTRPIESVLRRHPRVSDVVVLGVPIEIGDAVGAVLVADGVDRAEFETFLDEQPDLGPKQRPTRVWIVDTLPETATFKTARSALVASLGSPTWTT